MAAALLLYLGGLRWAQIGLPGLDAALPDWLALGLTLLYIVWMINLYNFMDGMDGFAGGMAVFGFGALAVLGLIGDALTFAISGLVIAAAAGGFLTRNFPPARIFLGDVGSSVLGLLAAAMTLWGAGLGLFPLWVGLLVFSPFIVDATWTLLRRIVNAEPFWRAHRSHHYQRLVLAGWGHRRTVAAGLSAHARRGGERHRGGPHARGRAMDAVTRLGGGVCADPCPRRTRRAACGSPTAMTVETKPSVKRWFDRLRSRTAAFSHDLLMVPVAWMLAYWMRFNLQEIPPPFLSNALHTLPLVMLACAVVYWSFGLYRGVWRFASLPDLVRITKAVLAATVAVMLVLFVYNRGDNVPRSVPLLFLLFQLALLSGPRLFYRWLKDHRLALHSGERVLIVGARGAGETLVREMRRDGARTYDPVAFVDDTPRRQGGEIHGIPIKGSTANIPRLVEDLAIDLIMLAVPTASAAEMQRLVELCERTGKPFRTVPQLQSLLSGQVTINQLRPVSIEDLLGRTPVTLDWDALRAGLADRVVLVTGAGGSIGSELCRQVVAAGPRRLVMLDNTEFNLYRVGDGVRGESSEPRLQPLPARCRRPDWRRQPVQAGAPADRLPRRRL